MNGKAKNIIFTAVTLLAIIASVRFLGSALRPKDMDIAVDSVNALHDMPDNSIDVLCIGSSHMWRGLDPTVLRNEYGYRAYNFGCYYQKINTSLLFLRDAFRTQSPRLVIIDTFYCSRLKKDSQLDGELYSTKNIAFSKYKLQYLYSLFGTDAEKYLTYFVPLAAFHGNYMSIFSDSRDTDISKTDLRDTFGFAASDKISPSHLPENAAAEQKTISPEADVVLTDIVRLCRENGAAILFITIPYEEPFAYSNAMNKFAKENGYNYVNLFDYISDIGLDNKTDFSDTSHLNSSGAKKIASFIGRYISENYTLTG